MIDPEKAKKYGPLDPYSKKKDWDEADFACLIYWSTGSEVSAIKKEKIEDLLLDCLRRQGDDGYEIQLIDADDKIWLIEVDKLSVEYHLEEEA